MCESLNLFLNRLDLIKVNLFVHGAGWRMIKEANSCLQWFLSLKSVASNQKPLLAVYYVYYGVK